jgi:hypothetical protein
MEKKAITNLLVLSVLIPLGFFIGCAGSRPLVQSEAIIYMAGSSENGPSYWINREAHVLNVSNEITSENQRRVNMVSDIAAHNEAVYVVGYTYLTEDFVSNDLFTWQTSEAILWINGVQTILSEGLPARAISILFHENDLYVSGWCLQDNKPKACYWINGTPHILDSASENISNAICLFVEKDVVYAGGQKVELVSGGGYKFLPCYWSNGDMHFLSNTYASVLDIYKSNNTIIMAGQYHDYYSLNNPNVYYTNRFIWREGADNVIHKWAGMYGRVNRAAIANGDIYFVGRSKGGVACYWVNDTATEFLLPMDSYASRRQSGNAENIFIYENKIYITGSVQTNVGSSSTYCYWIDNVRYDLPGATDIRCIYVGR